MPRYQGLIIIPQAHPIGSTPQNPRRRKPAQTSNAFQVEVGGLSSHRPWEFLQSDIKPHLLCWLPSEMERWRSEAAWPKLQNQIAEDIEAKHSGCGTSFVSQLCFGCFCWAFQARKWCWRWSQGSVAASELQRLRRFKINGGSPKSSIVWVDFPWIFHGFSMDFPWLIMVNHPFWGTSYGNL